MSAHPAGHHKDEILDRLARHANVAQFISFAPDLAQRYAWIHGHEPGTSFDGIEAAVSAILAAAPEKSVNVRSFEPLDPKSREFLYGLRTAEEVVSNIRRLAAEGLFTIVNETVDVKDGGVSGVAHGGVVEFSPDDTPRAVEKPGTLAMDRAAAMRLFKAVYGFAPALPEDPDRRVEFSLHPLRRGYRHEHVIVWEEEDLAHGPRAAQPAWPNRFSRLIGDKAFGLLVAWLHGFPVPDTTVVGRRVAPFRFGEPTGIADTWLRTCPTEQVPGHFTTVRGWTDPYVLLHKEDPAGDAIASVLAQRGVDARWSGALISEVEGAVRVEGVPGYGDDFMQGKAAPEDLPIDVWADVMSLHSRVTEALGPVRFEWVHDGRRAWIVQLHSGASTTAGQTIYPGEAARWLRFDVADGIGALRRLIQETLPDEGIVLVGRVGITSHLGDILRRARIPSRIEPA